MIAGLEISQQAVVEVPRCMRVKFSGSIDTCNLKYYNQKIDKIFVMGFVHLIFDLGQLSHFSSAWDCGIGVLRKIKPLGGCILLQNKSKGYSVRDPNGTLISGDYRN